MALFKSASDVLDIGCGRGELLDLLREQGLQARGIDINDEMVALCRGRGLTAEKSDAIAFLNACRLSATVGIVSQPGAGAGAPVIAATAPLS